MDVDVSAEILAGSILTMMAIIVFVVGVVVINNILYKYWKPVKIFTPDSWKAFNPPNQYASQEELNRIAPILDKKDH